MKKWFLRAEKTNSAGNMASHDAKHEVYPSSREKSIYPKAFGLLSLLILVPVFLLGTAFAEMIPEETSQKLKGLRVPFILNQGQTDQQVKFYARTFSGTVYVTEQGRIVYELPTDKDRKDRRWVLVEEALEGLALKEIKGEKGSETKVSYFLGNDPSQWRRDLPTYETVDVGEVYEGIALKLRAYGGSVEKLYYISPGKDPGIIRIKVDGAESLTVNGQGELEVQTGNGPVIFSRPRAFQQEGGRQADVEVAYLVNGDSYGFKVGSYDVAKVLVIDPLIQSTYLGGSGDDFIDTLSLSGGNVYVAGYTSSNPFPGTAGGAQPVFGGNYDAFVARLSADLKSLIQSTYLGGSGTDFISTLSLSGGNVYLAGQTSSDPFPGTAGGAQPGYGGNGDGFVALLSGDLTTLIRSTYLGGSADDGIGSLSVAAGNVYVAGQTSSDPFPGTAGGARPGYGGGGDGFVALLSGDLTTLIRSTYLGGSAYDGVDSLAVADGNVYVAGTTFSSDIPGTAEGAQPAYGGSVDAFMSLLSGDLTTLTRSTYLGGDQSDNGRSITISGGNVYVTGQTWSTDFPGTAGGAQEVGGGAYWDGFVALLSGDLKTLTQSTYLGGSGDERIFSLAVSGGNVYVAGQTTSDSFPGTAGGAQPAYGGAVNWWEGDGFVSLLSGDLKTLIQSTYLGGSGDDIIFALALSGGTVYVVGQTSSNPFPGTTGGAQPAYGGGGAGFGDGFVALLSGDLKAVSVPVANAVSATVAYNSINNPITLNITGGTPTSVAVASGASYGTATASGTSITYTPTTGYFGSDSFTYTATNAGGTSAPATVTITVTLLAPVANPVSATVAYGSSNNPITLNITGGAPTGVAVSGAASHGTATASGISITYTPTAGYSGGDSFTYTATNAAGTSAPATVTITVSRTGNENSDRDGLPDLEEQGPYGNDPSHDGNGDGIPDWQQGNVVSFHTSARDRSHYITLAAPSGLHIESLYGERNFDTPPPEWVSFPYGFFSFTIARLPAGSATTVTIYLDGTPPQTYYKYGKTPDIPVDHWYEFAYDGETGAEVVGNTVVLHFIDGKRGDHDLEANGGITDPGGPAEIAPHAGLYFPYLVSTSDEKTEIGIINTKSYASRSTISYYGANGDLLRTAAITLGPYGKAAISSAGIPPGSANAIVSGDGDLAGYTRYVNGAGKRCAWAAATSLQKTFSVPHTAVNAEWATALGLLNPNDAAVEVTLVYESGGSSKLTLNPKASTFIQLTEVESVLSIISTGYISAMEMFDSLLPGGDAAAVLLKERSLNALYVPSILSGPGEFTGVGLTSYHHGTVTVTGHRATGGTEELSFGTQPLGAESPRSRIAFHLSGMLGKEDRWAKISGEADFATPFGKPLLHFQGLAVYGKENTGKLGAVNLNALRFREGFIGILSGAPEISITLLNPGSAEATITVTGYGASGGVLSGTSMKIAAGSNWTGTASDLLNGATLTDTTHIKIASDVDLCGFEAISSDGRTEMLSVMGIE